MVSWGLGVEAMGERKVHLVERDGDAAAGQAVPASEIEGRLPGPDHDNLRSLLGLIEDQSVAVLPDLGRVKEQSAEAGRVDARWEARDRQRLDEDA